MKELLQERYFYYFEQISRIPRESGNEKAVSDWIFQWAKKLGLRAVQDAALNLVIYKQASCGYEACSPVLLQAHMDMVCEKTPDSAHDFANDPIRLCTDGEWLMSACDTTLGADNGIGMACAMAILEDKTLCHPPLEVIFTVEEETTFKGANALNPALVLAKRMINLDHAQEEELIAGSCGGTGAEFKLPLVWETVKKEDCSVWQIKLEGLLGGHSGEDIHRGRGNAIKLLMRVLQKAVLQEALVISICGGTNRLAIPREASALLACKNGYDIQKAVSTMLNELKKELGAAGASMNLQLVRQSCKEENIQVLNKESFEKVIQAVLLFPDGIFCMSSEFTGQVTSSDNLGILEVFPHTGGLKIVSEIRGLYPSMVEDTADKIRTLAAVCGAEAVFFDGYGSWEYRPVSPLREWALLKYRELYKKEMKVSVIHAGLEGAMFSQKIPGMDIISVGPDCQFFHSPKERVRIASVRRFYEFLTQLLTIK